MRAFVPNPKVDYAECIFTKIPTRNNRKQAPSTAINSMEKPMSLYGHIVYK